MFRLGIETFWRERSQEMPESRATSLHLDASFIGDLPTLSADFSHVRTLSITGNPRLTAGTGFLNNFTSLETLELRDLNLRAVPEALNQMPDLQLLVMNNCAIVLDEEGADTLSSLTRLVSLDLYNNPLGRSPDLRSMPALKFLDLANTGIDELPSGLTTLPHLNTAILSGNLIRELPAALFDLPTDVSKGYDLNNNPLSAAARESIKTYYRVNGVDFAVLAEPADIARIQTLYPTLDDGEASKLLYRFEGTLADGRTELARHEAELDRLRQDLAAWENDLPEALTVRARELEQSNRQEFRDSLLRCWRLRAIDGYHEFTSLIPIRGRLPTLSVEFAHVYSLDLHGQNGFPIHPGRFLDAFANLQLLEIRNYDMLNIPEAIFRMKRLKGLILPSCRITLSPEDVARLATLDRLDLLHLQDNPLGLTPDLRNLQELIDLDLSNTGIREIPKGVLENSHWEEVDLSNNQINEMPEELMEVPAVIGDRYDLSGNLFSPRAMARIREYYDVTGQDLNVEGLIDQPPARLGIAIEP
jgi:Leucine-rich repeat (LRR) protein